MKTITTDHFLTNIYLNIRKVALLVAIFLYIYSIPLRFLPFGIGTRMIFFICGIVLISFDIFKNVIHKKQIYIHRDIVWGVLLFLAIGLLSLLTMLINSSKDFGLLKYSFSMLFIIVAGYFIVRLCQIIYVFVSFSIISKYVIVAVLLQVIIAALMFFNPTVRTSLYEIQNLSVLDTILTEQVVEFRLIGFGSAFFGAGIVNGFALMLIATTLKIEELNLKQVFFYSLAFVIIFSLGMMMARVTLIGGIFALIILFFPSRPFKLSFSKKIFSFFSLLILIPVLILALLPFSSEENREKVNLAIDYGFELFENFTNEGQLRTASTDDLKASYRFPTHFKTYLIGDGYFVDPSSPDDSYYMGVDAGYLRLIYYFGLLGLFVYFMFQLIPIIVSLKKNDQNLKLFFILSFAYFLVLNTKGFTDILPFSILFCFTQNSIANSSTAMQ